MCIRDRFLVRYALDQMAFQNRSGVATIWREAR
jgi:hypothetical protein